jgi:hypothetical protein
MLLRKENHLVPVGNRTMATEFISLLDFMSTKLFFVSFNF